jgi:preprotein translocase subunit SecY
MKKFFESLANVWKIEGAKNRILITLGILLVYRFGAHVTLPGIDATQINSLAGQTKSGIGSILDMFTGGAFSKASVFALGDYALYFGIHCSSINGNRSSLFAKIAK